ncbi:MAG: type II toxin-antitoxin system Phd/YefM family antitoxin [Xenococcaceae cyanobacterium MO_188.B29]|nr:type II toxin-antitoxin system Phd/YefM family antitoxin [Xenococcaceae cyanobacterium MO_188.B29]
MLNQWQLQEAKNKFSQVIKQAQQGNPQYITVHGKPTAVIVSIEDYQKLNQPQTSLSEALMIPLIEQDLDLSYTILGVRRNTSS